MNQDKKNAGFFITKNILIITAAVIVCVYGATILGLIFGLKGAWYDKLPKTHDTVNHTTMPMNETMALTTTTVMATAPPKNNHRLPNNLKPFYYDLKIDTRFDPFTEPREFNGDLRIDFICDSMTDKIVLNADNMTVYGGSVSIKGITQNDFELNDVSWLHDVQTSFLTIYSKKNLLETHKYSVFIKFKANFQSKVSGLYRQSYQDAQNRTRWLIASQMEPMFARKVLPCFDEPAMKAQFKFTVIHHRDLHAASNMPPLAHNPVDFDYVQTEFDVTVRLSTYLIGLFITDFQCKSDIASAGLNNSLLVQSCSRPMLINKIYYPLSASIKYIEHLQRLFGLPYPLPKLESYAIPNDHRTAMENFGIFRFGEILYLTDENSPEFYVEDSSMIIGHEVAHTWFGNLVTPEWWSDLWIKEGFAVYYEYAQVDNAFGNYEIYDEFQMYLYQAMDQESILNAHPAALDPDTPYGLYDDITYLKGAGIIKMLNLILGRQAFTNALKKLIINNMYGTMTQDTLWQYMDEQSQLEGRVNMNIGDIMSPWAKQSGLPVVTVKRVDMNKIEVKQNRYLLHTENMTEASSTKWYIPFTYAQQQYTKLSPNSVRYNVNELYKQVVWLKPDEESKIIYTTGAMNNTVFIIGNLDAAGYYRVNYDAHNWNLIIEQLKGNNEVIPVKLRSQLISDVFSFAQTGLVDATKPLDLIQYISNEVKCLPWRTLFKSMVSMVNMIESTHLYPMYQDYMLKLIKPVYDRLTWTVSSGDTWNTKKLRTAVFDTACAYDHMDCVSQATAMFASYMNNPKRNLIPPSLREAVYCTGVRHGTRTHWDFLYNQYINESDEIQKDIMRQGLACAREPAIINQYLESQYDSFYCFFGFLASAKRLSGSLVVWNFVKENYQKISDRCGGNGTVVGIISYITNKFNKQYQLDDLKNFIHSSQLAELDVLNKVKFNMQWLQQNYEALSRRLKELADVN